MKLTNIIVHFQIHLMAKILACTSVFRMKKDAKHYFQWKSKIQRTKSWCDFAGFN